MNSRAGAVHYLPGVGRGHDTAAAAAGGGGQVGGEAAGGGAGGRGS